MTDEADDSLPPDPPAKKARGDPFADMRDGNPMNEDEPTSHSRASGREELARYNAMRVPAEHSSPPEFWKENGREFPLLAEVARRILCISASSAQSERDFSAVSRTITDVVQGCRPKLLKQWNSFVGQCVVHCLT